MSFLQGMTRVCRSFLRNSLYFCFHLTINSIVKEQCLLDVASDFPPGLGVVSTTRWLIRLANHLLSSQRHILYHTHWSLVKGGFQKNFWDDLFLFRSSHLPRFLEGFSLYSRPLLLHPWSMVDPHSDAFSFASKLRFVSPQY